MRIVRGKVYFEWASELSVAGFWEIFATEINSYGNGLNKTIFTKNQVSKKLGEQQCEADLQKMIAYGVVDCFFCHSTGEMYYRFNDKTPEEIGEIIADTIHRKLEKRLIDIELSLGLINGDYDERIRNTDAHNDSPF